MRMVEEIMGEAKELLQQSSGENFLETMGKIKILNDEAYKAVTAGIPFDRLEAICNAERDGRCYTPPVKIGDTVYWRSRFGNAIHQGKVYEIKISSFGFDLELRTAENQRFLRESEKCYFTREAAEAALKEREQNDN